MLVCVVIKIVAQRDWRYVIFGIVVSFQLIIYGEETKEFDDKAKDGEGSGQFTIEELLQQPEEVKYIKLA
jgi:hypothetical protein